MHPNDSSALIMKLGDFKAWIYVDDQAQMEHNHNTVQNSFTEQGHKVRRSTRSGVVAATRGDSFQARWVCDTKAPGYSLHYSLYFHNMKIDTGVVGSPDFNDVWILDGDYEFCKQTTTGIDECADIDDDNIATIRLEFQWVKPCLKRISSKKSCLECSKLRDQGESSQPAKKSRRTSYSTSIPIDPNRIVPGLVHEDSKRAHGLAAISHTYRNLKDDEDENFRFHGTFKDQHTLRFFIGPEKWLESKGWIEPRARAPEQASGAEQSSSPPSVASEQDSDQSLGPAKKRLQSGFGQWAGKGNPLAIDKGNTCTQAESGSTSTAAEQIIDIDDDDEDEKPLISSSPPTSVEIKRESPDTGEEQPGANLASMIGLLLREVRQGNALMRQMNEGFNRLVQTRERNTNSH